jgi:GTPase SAR1 family protein
VNRGDSFRRRRSRSNSLLPPTKAKELAAAAAAVEKTPPTTYPVGILGASGVGKTALVDQFMTSDCINAYAYDRQTSESALLFYYIPCISCFLNTPLGRLTIRSPSRLKNIDKKYGIITRVDKNSLFF